MSIILLGEQTPTFPEEFQRRLQSFDKDLLLMWHKPPHWPRERRGVWKVEQCVEHRPAGGPHDHLCRRIYVLMCQDEDGTPKPLGEWIFEKLREMRANSESFGGETPRGLRNFVEHSNNIDAELALKCELASQDMIAYNQKDKRIQINKLYNLIERHDMRPNK